jgi:flagellar biosynthesis GTPase FlhF
MSAAAVVEKRVVMSTETKTFRGSSLEEVLPKIKADLGPDAEIVRQREGLTGGVGGFFQRACIEVDARAAEPAEEAPRSSRRRFDAYDDEPAMPEPMRSFEPDPLPAHDEQTAEGLTAPGIQEILRQAAPFADHLDAAARRVEPAREEAEPASEPEAWRPEPTDMPRRDAREPEGWRPEPYRAEPEHAPAPEPMAAAERSQAIPARVPAGRPQVADALEEQLVEAGINPRRADEIVAETVSHLLPFASPRRLRKLVRQSLARRIPVAATPRAGGRSLAFVGPAGSGKTLCTALVAGSYASGSDLPVVCVALQPADGGAELRALVEPHGVGVTVADSAAQARAHIAGALGHALVVVDAPSSVTPEDLRTLDLDELHVTLPSMYSGAAAADIAARYSGTHIAMTHLDESSRVGDLLDALIDGGVPLSYVSRGPGGLEPADAIDLASQVLP